MRQNSDLLITPEHANASACGFFVRKELCGRGFRNLPHTSVLRIRKCGEKPSYADQTPALRFRDLRFCYHNLVCARLVPIFPRTSGNRVFRFRCLGSRCALSSRENQRSSRPCMHFLVSSEKKRRLQPERSKAYSQRALF